ncbi:MAG: hypothetical protein WBD99_06880 [Thermodesulfobacteriota bacterium]
MITIFSCPKPFRGDINIIQRNAIRSWTLLDPTPEIIVIGNEEGTVEVSEEFGLCNISEVERNEYGTPLVNSIFAQAERVARYPLMCYVNSDIIFMSDFIPAVKMASKEMPGSLLVGRRLNVDLSQPLDFSKSWEEFLIYLVAKQARAHNHTAMDYFVFSKGLWDKIPPFALGRRMWDNWLVYGIRSKNIPVVDMSEMIKVVHQDHDYDHYPGGIKALWESAEARKNIELAGGYGHAYSLRDTNFRLTKRGVKRNIFIPIVSFYYKMIYQYIVS